MNKEKDNESLGVAVIQIIEHLIKMYTAYLTKIRFNKIELNNLPLISFLSLIIISIAITQSCWGILMFIIIDVLKLANLTAVESLLVLLLANILCLVIVICGLLKIKKTIIIMLDKDRSYS